MSLEIQTAIVNRELAVEGGVVNDPVDKGGPTRWGQTAAWLKEYGLPEPKDVAQAAANFLTWLSLTKLAALCTVDDALANSTIDSAIHDGTGRAIRVLQSALGARPDGVIGPQTLAALEHCDRGLVAVRVWRDHGDACVSNVLGDPLLKDLIAKTQLRFLKGHWNRLKAQVPRL